jgi:disulfide bond formation protein DsbB
MLARLPAIELYKYVSHKVLRWMTAFSLGVAVLSGLLGLAAMQCWMGIGLMLALGVIGGSAMAISRRGAVSRLREILAAFAATGLGVYRSMRGDTFQIWTPPASARTVPAYIGEAA